MVMQWGVAMKGFVSTFGASALAMLLALAAYEVLVAQPRERRLEAALQEAIDGAGEAALAGRREAAAQVADELAASVDRSIATARDAMANEARMTEIRGRIADGLARASTFKLAVVEHYMSMARWPGSVAEVGLAEPAQYATAAVREIALGAEGVVAIRYSDAVAAGAEIVLAPTFRESTGMIEWRCEATGFPDRSLLPATCR